MKKDRVLTYKKFRHPEVGDIRLYQTSDYTSLAAAQFISDIVKDNPTAVITYATGKTMIPIYKILATMVDRGEVSFSKTKAFLLDEYYPCSPDSPHSFVGYIRKRVIEALKIKEENKFLIDGLAENPEAEAQRYNSLLKKEKIDLVILGIGPGGHIGFNEPGTPFEEETHFTALSQDTVNRDRKERRLNTPRHSITQGIANILRAKRILLVAYGHNKSDSLRAMLEGPITTSIPASALRLVGDRVSIFMDSEAAKFLNSGFSKQ